jgi:hypothetical protein
MSFCHNLNALLSSIQASEIHANISKKIYYFYKVFINKSEMGIQYVTIRKGSI